MKIIPAQPTFAVALMSARVTSSAKRKDRHAASHATTYLQYRGWTHRLPAVIASLLIALTCVGAEVSANPAINVSRSSVAFGFSPTTVQAPVQPVFVTNTGDSPLVITSLALSGAQAADYRTAGTCGTAITLAPSAQCRIDVFLTIGTSIPSNRSATLTITSNALPATTAIMLSGAVDPGLGDTLILPTPAYVDFGAQTLSTIASPITLKLTDNSSFALTIVSLQLSGGDSGDFAVTPDCAVGGIFTASRPCSVAITFRPTSTGPRSTELVLQLRANDITGTSRYSITGVGAVGTPAASVELNQHGLTGSWYDPSTSGQGFEIEVFPDLTAHGTGYTQVSWFTFDTTSGGADRQRWYTIGGPVVTGQASAALTIYQNAGGNFNALPVTTAQAVGTAMISFDSCISGHLSYSFTDGSSRNGTIALTRLTKNVTCSITGSVPADTDFAHSGNWFSMATSGQGFSIELNPQSGVLFFAWYTYAPNGSALGATGQRWYSGQATFVAGERAIPLTLYQTTGGIFDELAPPNQTTQSVGTGTLTYQSCSAATLSYNFTSGSSAGASGTITLARPGPVPLGCAS